MYHYVRTLPSIKSDYLGYKAVGLAGRLHDPDGLALAAWISPSRFQRRAGLLWREPAASSNPVVITFDDGYADLYTTAYPILAAHGFKAVAYIVSGFVGWPQYVNRAQIANDGPERHPDRFSHSRPRQPGAVLLWIDDAVFGRIQADAREPCWSPGAGLRLPFGSSTHRPLRLQAGYDTAVTTLFSVDHSVGDRYLWTRVRVGGGESLGEFVTKPWHAHAERDDNRP